MNYFKNLRIGFRYVALYYFLVIIAVLFIGCDIVKRQPLTVTFIDVSGAMSTDHTINIKFSEEKDYEQYYIDILVKSDTDVKLTLFQEFSKDEEKINLNITKDNGYVSLDEYKLFNLQKEQTDSMVGYADVLSTTLVVNSNKDATLTFLAIIGENKDGEFNKIGEVSKEYTLNVKKHEEK